MKSGTTLKISFILGFICSLIGAYMKFTHVNGAATWLITGVLSTLIFIVTAIYEIRTSNKIDNTEKLIWTFALIFFSGIAGFVYFFFDRKRIAANR